MSILLTGNQLIYANDRMYEEITISDAKIEEINRLVEEILSDALVPGLSLVLFNGEETTYLNYGYSDIAQNVEAESSTLYEIGSMSKAFTGLGILLLEQQGYLSLDDKVSDYLPWFSVYFDGTYNGNRVKCNPELTISNCLYQTTGIPAYTIGDIPIGDTDCMLEKTVRNICNIELVNYPGEKYDYATINYDILGLIIETVSNESYESFMYENILQPLGLYHTYMARSDVGSEETLAKGYKYFLGNIMEYGAPVYRGNTPAGYIISNTQDMERWMKIQLGMIDIPENYKEIIEKSHIADTTVPSQENYVYASGWDVSLKRDVLRHGGANPNYSSMCLIKPFENYGICILSNINSNAVTYLADNITNILEGKKVTKYKTGLYRDMDLIFSVVFILSVLGVFLYAWLSIRRSIVYMKGKRSFQKRRLVSLAIIPVIGVLYAISMYYFPTVFINGILWNAVNVWASPVISIGCIAITVFLMVFIIYVLLTFRCAEDKEIDYFSLIPLSLINGIAGALITLIINETFNRNLEYSKEFLSFYLLIIVVFVYTLKLLQGRLIVISNAGVYNKRMNIMTELLDSTYRNIEYIGKERIFSTINNDVQNLVLIPNLVVNFGSNLLVLLFCFSFLFKKSRSVFLSSLIIMIFNCVLGIFNSFKTKKYYEENRRIQDKYFVQMNDLVNGFKELVLNKLRKKDFIDDLEKAARDSKQLNDKASQKVLSFNLYNVFMYNLIFGIVVFIFPMIFSINTNELRENLLIIFYLIGPFNNVLGAVPEFIKIHVSINRINELIRELHQRKKPVQEIEQGKECTEVKSEIVIELKDVCFEYEETEETSFTLGPINWKIASEDITFITGGNGSGKSTIAKLITGLYSPTSGEILLNGNKVRPEELNKLFSAVFSDFHLFQKLYGIDYHNQKEMVQKYVDMLNMPNKVKINDKGEFENINLSTGQKKRLALLISCLENKPMMLFDEWAAEQDPKFRKYFYEELLPALHENKVGIIVISHDDRYFYIADNLLKLETGRAHV